MRWCWWDSKVAPPAGASDQVKELYDSGEFAGKSCELSVLHRPAGFKAKRLALAGGGKRDKFNSAELRKVTGAAFRLLKSKKIRSITLALDDAFRSDEFAAAAVEGAILGDFESDRYKTDPKKTEKHVDSFAVLGASQAALDRGRILAEAQNFTRSLANDPPNLLTPMRLAERARELASLSSFSAVKFSIRTACANWAWARCWAWPRAAPNLPR